MDGQDPMMGDQNIGGEQMPMDGPNMGDEQMPMDDPNMGVEQPPMDGQDPMMGDQNMGGDDSTMSIINQLNDEDREAVRAYAESMLGSQDSNEQPMGEPMMESVIFTKKQMDKLFENFGPTEDELHKDNTNSLSKKKTQNVSKKSPFNSPKFK
jgi:hypothetical protein